MKCDSVHQQRIIMKVLAACIFWASLVLSQRENEEITFSIIMEPIRG